MKDVKILGPGCAKCQELMDVTKAAVDQLSLECALEKVTDLDQIVSYGVMFTPALVVDGVVKVSGKVPSLDEIKKYLS